eukprot:4930920-Pleurochrysis_carterae.AAC.1
MPPHSAPIPAPGDSMAKLRGRPGAGSHTATGPPGPSAARPAAAPSTPYGPAPPSPGRRMARRDLGGGRDPFRGSARSATASAAHVAHL